MQSKSHHHNQIFFIEDTYHYSTPHWIKYRMLAPLISFSFLLHCIRTTRKFVKAWEDFLKHFDAPASPIFYQYVTDEVFKDMVRAEFARKNQEEDYEIRTTGINDMEENTLRYMAGYVLRKIKSKIEKSSSKYKDCMLLCISELTGEKMDGGHSEVWTNLIDRGGLIHVQDDTYDFFYQMEVLLDNICGLIK